MKTMITTLLLGSALAAFAPAAVHASEPQAQSAKKPTAKKSSANAEAEVDKDVELAGTTATEMVCAHGDKVTLYENRDDTSHLAMRWKSRTVRMHRVDTSTGANRFESQRHGLVWIGIPAKGMLLDSKKGQQLANECKSTEQMANSNEPSTTPFLLEARK